MADLQSTVIFDSLFPLISKSLENRSNIIGVQNFFGKVMNSSNNSEALGMSVPYKSLFVNYKDELAYYDCIGISDKQVMEAINKSTHIPKDSWHTVKQHMYMSLLLVGIAFYRKKDMKMFEHTMFIWSVYMYKNVKGNYFKAQKTGENALKCMMSTINRLSYKNDLKKYKTIQNTIVKKTDGFIANWFDGRPNDLKGSITDNILCRMIDDNYGRYNKLIRNFATEFYKDLESGNYMNVDQDIDTEDEYIESDNVSFMVEKNTQKVMNKFILSTYPNGKIMEQVCMREPDCSMNNLRNMVNYIYNDHERDFEKLVRVIIQVYLFDKKKKIEDLKTFDFEKEMREYYKGQAIGDKNLQELKEIVDKIFKNSNIKTTRSATINACKRAFYLYTVIYIRYSLIG